MKINKHLFPTIILGVILVFGLVSPAFVGASIIVTGSGPVEENPNEGWGIIVTGTSSYPNSSNYDSSTAIIPSGSSHNDSYNTLAIANNPPCHHPSCTTTTTHPLCHDSSCTRYTCNSNYQCVVASNGEYASLSTCQNNCIAPIRYSCNTNTYQCYATVNGQYASLSTCDANCNAPCPRYTCNSNYQCVQATNGEYTSLSTCNTNCNTPIKYACNTSTYQCYQYSSGPYTSLSTCQANCQAPIRYSCNTNTYQCYQTASGDYSNFNDCATNCQSPVTRYTCNSNYQCVVDSNGPYTSLGTCQNNCIAQTRYSCNYSTYQCYQTTSGSYISYNDCANACQQINQSLSVSCYASPNPAQTNQTVTFSSNVSGGSGNYSYYWSGATYGNNSYSQKSFSSYGNYTAYLTVNDSQNKSASTSCSVNVNQQYTNTPTLNLWADKYTIAQGESTYLRWTSTNASYCTASNGWSGSKSTSGYESVSPNSDTTYSLNCYGSSGGQITRSVTIYVTSVTTNLNLTKLGRNLSTGDRVYSKVIRVTEGDVIEFYLTVTAGNNKDLYNTNIKDIMPSVLSYMSGTTKINGIVQPDTITTTGLSLGTIYKGASKTIVFQAISASPGTYLTYTNTAEITADNESKITDSASITYGLVAGAATIRTGPLNTLLISFIISLVSALIIWYYLKFNPRGQLVFVKSENKIRDIWLAYTRRRIMRS